MIINRITHKWRYIIGGLTLSCIIISCTKDYFVDENNYWIYVPQIRERTIQDFYVAFHDMAGNHLRTRRFTEADFNQPYLTDGIVRSKLQVGEVNVMCFSQLNTIEISEGQPLSESYLSLPVVSQKDHIFTTANVDCRVFHKVKTVYPIGHPNAKLSDTISMDDNCVYTGNIAVQFKNLPQMVDRVDVFYSGLATRMNFDGTLGTFTPSDCVWVSYLPLKQSVTEKFEDSFFPSAGTLIGTKADGRAPLKLKVIFYSKGIQVGYLNEENLSEDHPVTDGQGKPVSAELFLEPRKTICFNFEGFTLVGIELEGWAGINPGDITPV